MVIELLDGPLKDVIHEVAGCLIPDSFALPDELGIRHWYKTNDDKVTAHYIKSERMKTK